MARLVVIAAAAPELVGLSFILPEGTCTIGREPKNDIVLADSAVSRRHALLEVRGDGCEIVDLGSGNGVWVNGQRSSRHRLADGDELGIGETTFRFVAAGTGEETARLPGAAAAHGERPTLAAPPLPPPPPALTAPPISPPADLPAAVLPAAAAPPRPRASGCAIGCFVASVLLFLGTVLGAVYVLYRSGHLRL